MPLWTSSKRISRRPTNPWVRPSWSSYEHAGGRVNPVREPMPVPPAAPSPAPEGSYRTLLGKPHHSPQFWLLACEAWKRAKDVMANDP